MPIKIKYSLRPEKKELASCIKKRYSTSDAISNIIAQRIDDIDEAVYYFSDDFDLLKDVLLSKDILDFANIVKKIIDDGANVVISSGKTVDKIVSSVLLYYYLKSKDVDISIKSGSDCCISHNGKPREVIAALPQGSVISKALLALEFENKEAFFELLDLVAISIIADEVSIKADNRILLKHGIEELNKRKRLNLQGILCQGNLIGVDLSAGDIEKYVIRAMDAACKADKPDLLLDVLIVSDREFIDIYSRSLLSVFSQQHAEKKEQVDCDKTVVADVVIMADELDNKFISDLEKLSPFGKDNENPVFLFKGLQVLDVQRFSTKNRNVNCKFKLKGAVNINAVMWGEDSESTGIKKGDIVDVIGIIERSYFRANKEYRINIIEIG